MANVLGIHSIQLQPGVSAEQFERFVQEEWQPMVLPGLRTRIVKGDRGEQAGTFAAVIEIDSVEIRDRYFPAPGGQPSEEFSRAVQALGDRSALDEKWASLASSIGGGPYTDWVVVRE